MFTTIVTYRIGTALTGIPVVVTHIQDHTSIRKFINCALISTGLFNDTAQLSMFSGIIGINQLGTVGF